MSINEVIFNYIRYIVEDDNRKLACYLFLPGIYHQTYFIDPQGIPIHKVQSKNSDILEILLYFFDKYEICLFGLLRDSSLATNKAIYDFWYLKYISLVGAASVEK